MSGPNQTTQNTSQLVNAKPYAAAAQPLQGILGQVGGISAQPTAVENQAIGQLTSQGLAGNQFAPQIGNVANELFSGGPDRTGMVSDAYGQYQQNLAGTVGGQFLDPNQNPFFSQTTGAIADQVRDRVASMYAGSGRDPSGAGSFGYNLAGETARALAPMYANIYNTERGRQLDSMNNLFGAGGQTAGLLSNLDQNRLGNMQAGIGAAGAAFDAQSQGPLLALQAEAGRRGIPLETLAARMGITLPAAQAFGPRSTTGTQTTEVQQPLINTVGGGLIGGVGLLGGTGAFGQGGWLKGLA